MLLRDDVLTHTLPLYLNNRFADIKGFSAWASVREPFQVFSFLEIVYHSWDMIARRRGVFKVETVRDRYTGKKS